MLFDLYKPYAEEACCNGYIGTGNILLAGSMTPDSFDVVTGKYCNMMSYANSSKRSGKGCTSIELMSGSSRAMAAKSRGASVPHDAKSFRSITVSFAFGVGPPKIFNTQGFACGHDNF